MENTTTVYAYAVGHYRDKNNTPIMLAQECDKERYEIEFKVNWQTAYKYEVPNDELEEFRKTIQGEQSVRNYD